MRQLLVAACLLSVSTLAAAAPQGIDSRSNAMGGAQVSSAHYRSAGFVNPALLTRHKQSEDWGLVIPTVSTFAADPNELVDAADAFTQEFDRIEAIFDMAGVPTQQELDDLAASLLNLDQRSLIANVGVGLSVAIPDDDLGIALVVDGRLAARSFINVADADAAAISGSLGGGALPDLTSNAVVIGALVTDYGISLAHAFEVGGSTLSVGVTPKAQTIETFNYRVDANDFSEDDQEDDFTDDIYRSSESDFNIDAGLLLEATDSLAVGLSVRNLISQDVQSVTTLGESFTYSLEPMATVGASWKNGPLTLAADYDLTETEPFDFVPGSRFLGLGAEMGWKWGQLRGGYRMDLEDETEDVLTAGLGFSPFGILTLDIAGALGDDTYGATIQLGFSF